MYLTNQMHCINCRRRCWCAAGPSRSDLCIEMDRKHGMGRGWRGRGGVCSALNKAVVAVANSALQELPALDVLH